MPDRWVDDPRSVVAREPDRGAELRLHPPVVGHEVVHALAIGRTRPAAEHDVEVLRLAALDRRELLHVRADLEDRPGLHMTRELRVRDLVVVGTEGAVGLAGFVVTAEEEVRVAAPSPVEERRLVDDVRPAPHRVQCLGGGLAELGAGIPGRRHLAGPGRGDRRPVLLDLDDPAALGHEVVEVALLVLEAALRDELDARVVADRLRDEANHRRPLERKPVPAREEPDEIRGGVDRATVDELHARPSYVGSVPARVSRPRARTAAPVAAP